MEKVNKYEKDCLDNFNNNFKSHYTDIDSNMIKANEWLGLIKKPDCEEAEVNKIYQDLEILNIDTEFKTKNFRSNLFGNFFPNFEINNIFGRRI